MKSSVCDMNNVVQTDNRLSYNFGIRKPVLDVDSLLLNPIWRQLINNWVLMIDEFNGDLIFFKHIIHHQRIMQFIYSGKDIFGDGVYTLYKVDLVLSDDKKDFFVDPIKYEISYGSFDFELFEEYLAKAVEDGYITKKEMEILLDDDKKTEFAKNLYVMKYIAPT